MPHATNMFSMKSNGNLKKFRESGQKSTTVSVSLSLSHFCAASNKFWNSVAKNLILNHIYNPIKYSPSVSHAYFKVGTFFLLFTHDFISAMTYGHFISNIDLNDFFFKSIKNIFDMLCLLIIDSLLSLTSWYWNLFIAQYLDKLHYIVIQCKK